MLEDVFGPTQIRMLEIQEKFGSLCEMQTDQGIDHRKMYKQMEESLGLGRSTLKQQIMSDVFKANKSFESTIKENRQEQDEKFRNFHNEMITFENKLKIWQDV